MARRAGAKAWLRLGDLDVSQASSIFPRAHARKGGGGAEERKEKYVWSLTSIMTLSGVLHSEHLSHTVVCMVGSGCMWRALHATCMVREVLGLASQQYFSSCACA